MHACSYIPEKCKQNKTSMSWQYRLVQGTSAHQRPHAPNIVGIGNRLGGQDNQVHPRIALRHNAGMQTECKSRTTRTSGGFPQRITANIFFECLRIPANRSWATSRMEDCDEEQSVVKCTCSHDSTLESTCITLTNRIRHRV